MALINPVRYVQQRYPTAANDPVWHWSALFKGCCPPEFVMHDLDAEGEYRGHHLFIEAKPVGAPLPKRQIDRLVKLAANPLHSVLIVGLVSSVDCDFNTNWREACWVWVGNPQWRDPRSVCHGSRAEFKEMMKHWFRRIDVLEDFRLEREHHRPVRGPQLELFAA